MPDPEGTETYVAVPLSSYSHSSSVAEKTLVHGNSEFISSIPSETASDSGALNTTKDSDKASKSRNVSTNSLDAVDRQFRKVGFSKDSRKLLKAAWRTGTQKDYGSKFRVFSGWCRARQTDPYSATLVQIVQFLTDIYHKGLQYRTVSGYRSMLSAVLSPIEGHKVGQHPYVIQLLKGVFNSRPPTVRLIPEWDLLKVLEALQKAPFEPLHKAPLKLVAFKTVFLIAITSYRRCSDLQSLRLEEGSINIQQKGITFIRHGLAKQNRPSHFGATIFIPAFPENKKLDPKRSLYYYLKATEK